jgi:hypothetical protein
MIEINKDAAEANLIFSEKKLSAEVRAQPVNSRTLYQYNGKQLVLDLGI